MSKQTQEETMPKKTAGHTPGPWRVIEQDDEMVISSDTSTDDVATVFGGDSIEANAKLIAAAPSLLEALKGMLEWARRVKQSNPGLEVLNAIIAIDKAEGR